jgi:hypothetical protein
MQDFIRQRNIELFRAQLATGRLDEAQRNYLEEMLANELAKEVRPEAPMPPKDIDERN